MRSVVILFVVVCGLASLAAGCSGQARPGGFLPGSAPNAAFGSFHRRRGRRYRAKLYLRIPAPRQHRLPRHHGPRYISPATRSVTISVVPAGGTPMPLQTLVVATPSPCATTSATNSALTCSFDVAVMPGDDAFTVAAYAQPSPTGSPLSQYVTPTAIPMPSPGDALGFTLEGVVDHVEMFFNASVPTTDAYGQDAALPAGVATSAPFTVIPYDAQNYEILAQYDAHATPIPYDQPVTLTVSPADSGVTLSNAVGSGSSVTIDNPDDLAVTALYDGTADATDGIVKNSTFAIFASGPTIRNITLRHRGSALRPERARRGRHRPADLTQIPNEAEVALASSAIEYPLVSSAASPIPLGLTYVATSGKMAFATSGYSSGSGVIGEFDPASPAAGATQATVSLPLTNLGSGIFADSDGDVWVADSSNELDCFTSVSATPALKISYGAFVPSLTYATAASMTEDAAHNLWAAIGAYTTGYTVGIGQAALTAPCTLGTLAATEVTPAGGASFYPASAVALTSLSGAWFGDEYSANLFEAFPGAAPSTPPTPAVSPIPVTTPVSASAVVGLGRIGTQNYAAIGAAGQTALDTIDNGGIIAQATTAPLQPNPPTTLSSSGGILSPLGGYQADSGLQFAVLGTASALALPFPDSVLQGTCAGAFDGTGNPWGLCGTAAGVSAYRVLLTPTWSLLPSTNVQVSVRNSCALTLGIAEEPSRDSGPFTVISSNTSVVSISSSPSGFDHEIRATVNPPATGTASAVVTVTDASGRSVAANVSVTYQASAYCGGA